MNWIGGHTGFVGAFFFERIMNEGETQVLSFHALVFTWDGWTSKYPVQRVDFRYLTQNIWSVSSFGTYSAAIFLYDELPTHLYLNYLGMVLNNDVDHILCRWCCEYDDGDLKN